jgi:hypothetical protein
MGLPERGWDEPAPAGFDVHLPGQRSVVLFVYLPETYDLKGRQVVFGFKYERPQSDTSLLKNTWGLPTGGIFGLASEEAEAP